MAQPINFDEIAQPAPSKPQVITLDEVLSAREAAARPIPRAGEPPVSFGGRPGGDFIVRNGQLMLTPRIEPAQDSNFEAALKKNLVEDPDTQARLISESLGIDPSRVGFVEGKPVYVDDSGQLRYVSSSSARFGAAVLANVPEAAGAIVGGLSASPVVGSTLGAMGARGLTRAAAGLIFNEPQTVRGNLLDVAGEGALNLAAAGIGKGVAKFGNRGRIVDFTPENIRTAEQAREYIKRTTGIDVDLAQASGNRKLIAIRGYAARFPGRSAELIQAADETANGQLDAAVSRIMDLVATSTPAEIGATRGVNAAQMALTAARQRVNQEVKPLYDAAYAAVPVVDRTTRQGAAILDYLKLPYFREAFAAGQKLRALETGSAMQPQTRTVETFRRGTPEEWSSASTTVQSTPTGARLITSRMSEGGKRETAEGTLTTRSDTVERDITGPSLAELDYTKRALDERIESLMESGQRQRARALKIKRDEFVKALDALPNQQWQAARQKYAELAKSTIEPLENSIVGVLANIRNPRLANVAAKVLGDKNVSPDQIAWASRQIRLQDPEAWNGLVRQYIANAWNKAQRETQTAGVVNPAGKLRQALIGTPQDKARMQAMLPPQAVQAFDDLMTAAESLSRTPIAGSNTMRDTEIRDQLRGTGAVVFRWLTTPRQAIQSAAEQRALEQNTLAVTEAILDPAKQKQLRTVVRMAPSTRKAIMLTSILGGQAAQIGAQLNTGPTIVPTDTSRVRRDQ